MLRQTILDLIKHGGQGSHNITQSPQTVHNPHKKKSQATSVDKINAVAQGELPKSKLKEVVAQETKQEKVTDNKADQNQSRDYKERTNNDFVAHQEKLLDETINQDEALILHEYTRSSQWINGYARQVKDPEKGVGEMGKKIRNMDSAFEKSKQIGGIPHDTILHRGIDSEFLRDQLDSGNLKVGSIMVDKGFASTTIDKKVADNFSKTNTDDKENAKDSIVLRIKTPKGTPAIYIGERSAIPAEQEMLLDRNTPMKVLGVKKTKNGYELEVEVMPK